MKIGSAWLKHYNETEKREFVLKYDENIMTLNSKKHTFLFKSLCKKKSSIKEKFKGYKRETN